MSTSKSPIQSADAPAAIGVYSQAIRSGDTVYLSGQIPLDPTTQQLVSGKQEQVQQAFSNLSAVATAAGGSLDHIVKLNVYLTDLSDFHIVNEVMRALFTPPYPARAAVGVVSLPKGACVEVEGTMVVTAAAEG